MLNAGKIVTKKTKKDEFLFRNFTKGKEADFTQLRRGKVERKDRRDLNTSSLAMVIERMATADYTNSK